MGIRDVGHILQGYMNGIILYEVALFDRKRNCPQPSSTQHASPPDINTASLKIPTIGFHSSEITQGGTMTGLLAGDV